MTAFLEAPGGPPDVLCLDAAAISDVDLTAAQGLSSVTAELARQRVRLVVTSLTPSVQAQLGRYGLRSGAGAPVVRPTPGAVLED